MTAQDTHTAALAAIAQRREALAAETPDIWLLATPQTDYDDALLEILADGWRTVAMNVGGPMGYLIVAATNAFSRDTDALEAVLLRHDPVGNEPCCWTCFGNGTQLEAWPCPDATAALTALGVTP